MGLGHFYIDRLRRRSVILASGQLMMFFAVDSFIISLWVVLCQILFVAKFNIVLLIFDCALSMTNPRCV